MTQDAYREKDGQRYDRVSAVIGATIGGSSPEAAACEVAKHAEAVFRSHLAGRVHQTPSQAWNGRRFEPATREEEPQAVLTDYRRMQGEFHRVRQGWLDRGTLLNEAFDAVAAGLLDPNPVMVQDWIGGRLEEPKEWTERGTPIPWQCDHADVLARAAWLGRMCRDSGFTVVSTQAELYDDRRRITGTPDWIGVWDGAPCVGELKCGSEQTHHAVQAAAYLSMKVRPFDRPKWRAVLAYVKPDGYRVVVLGHQDWRAYAAAFDDCLRAYRATNSRDWPTALQSSDKKREKKAS